MVLDLSTQQICTCLYISRLSAYTEVIVKHADYEDIAKCHLYHGWKDVPIAENEEISISGVRVGEVWQVRDDGGLLVSQPRVLVTVTAVMAAVQCRRRALLQLRARTGLPQHAMTIGVLVHEVAQAALKSGQKQNESWQPPSLAQLRSIAEEQLKKQATTLALASLTLSQAREALTPYIIPLHKFLTEHASDKSEYKIEKVIDIEEMVQSPHYGLKGKIDATLDVKIRDTGKRQRVPLEMKSGRGTQSVEHRGQAMLYSIMTGSDVGLLHYVGTGSVSSVKVRPHERRDLLRLRNELANHLSMSTFPAPIDAPFLCKKCSHLTLCSLLERRKQPDSGIDDGKSIRKDAIRHLTHAQTKWLRSAALALLAEERLVGELMHANWNGLATLIEDTARSDSLRRLLVKDDGASDKMESIKIDRTTLKMAAAQCGSLNVQQRAALLRAVAAAMTPAVKGKPTPHLLLYGLPGTGKTQTVSSVIRVLVGLGKRVLIAAHTHAALDALLLRLVDPNSNDDSPKILRLGGDSRAHSTLKKVCEDNMLEENAENPLLVYKEANVVGVTCAGAARHPVVIAAALGDRSMGAFDVAVLEEAGQVDACSSACALLAGGAVLLLGDPRQLAPLARSACALRHMKRTSPLSIIARANASPNIAQIGLQYRMNGALCRLANRLAYSGDLRCANATLACSTLEIKALPPAKICEGWISAWLGTKMEDSIVVLECSGAWCGGAVAELAARAAILLQRAAGATSGRVALLAPTNAAVDRIQRCLDGLHTKDVQAHTIDRWQGREADAAVLSMWGSEGGRVVKEPRRLAVAVTRARYKLLLITKQVDSLPAALRGALAEAKQFNLYLPISEKCTC